MTTEVSKSFYEERYRFDGEGRRIDIFDSEDKKVFEIFFFGDDILIMSEDQSLWCNNIKKISVEVYGPLIMCS